MEDELTVQAGDKRGSVQHSEFRAWNGLVCIEIVWYIPVIVSFIAVVFLCTCTYVDLEYLRLSKD